MLKWVVERVSGKADAVKTAIGYMPTIDAIDTNGLDVSERDMAELLKVSKDEWLNEVESIREHYKSYGAKLPVELVHQLDALDKRLQEMA